jgi:hypothetical protein
MPYTVLDVETVIKVYLGTVAQGIGSARRTAERLSEMGYKNHNTGKALTKQAVLECLRKSERGRQILQATSRNKWRDRYA